MKPVLNFIKSNMVLGLLISIILFDANGIRIHIANSNITDWSLTEFLINYQGGFVRRGIFGEIVFNTNDPAYYTTLLQKGALVFVLIGLIAILIIEKSSLTRILFAVTFVFAPGGLHDMKGGGKFPGGEWEYLDRKEIWFYCALIIFYFSVKFLSKKPLLLTAIFIAVSMLMILHHELFVIFTLVLYTTILLSKRFNLKSVDTYAAITYYIFVLSTFYIVFTFHGDQTVSSAILNSYQSNFPGIITYGGAIDSISWSIADSHELPLRLISEGSILYYIYFAVLAVLFLLLYTIVKFKNKANFYLAILLNTGILIGCLLISYVFWDVGRLISIYVFITLISLNVLDQAVSKFENQGRLRFASKNELSEIFQKNFIIFFLVGYLIFISLITRVNHCCPQPNEIPLRSFLGILN